MIKELTDITEALEIGLPYTANHRVYLWSDGSRKVYFSATRNGQGMSIHLAARRKSRIALFTAVEEFCQFVFEVYDWCKMILGIIHSRGIMNLAKRCGFEKVGSCQLDDGRPATIMVRPRPWADSYARQ